MIHDFESISTKRDTSLQVRKHEDIQNMKDELLSCNDNPTSVKNALQNITVLRVYHQLSRIIEYTELMDKLEDKLYESLNNKIDDMNPDDDKTWMMLLSTQEKLQKNMIDSMKLIEPYLDLTQYTIIDQPEVEASESSSNTINLDANKREKLRNSAQSVLKELNVG